MNLLEYLRENSDAVNLEDGEEHARLLENLMSALDTLGIRAMKIFPEVELKEEDRIVGKTDLIAYVSDEEIYTIEGKVLYKKKTSTLRHMKSTLKNQLKTGCSFFHEKFGVKVIPLGVYRHAGTKEFNLIHNF